MGNFLTVKKPSGLEALLKSDQVLPSLVGVATSHLPPNQIGPLFAAAALKNPKVLECTVTSIIDAALYCCRYGLGPGDGGVYLVPFKNTLTTIIDYKGLIQLAYRSGMVESMGAEVIHENDQYEVEYGTNRTLVHVPKIGDQGKPIAAYATCTLTNGAVGFRLLDEAEIMRHKPKKVMPDSPWNLHPMSMWMKTAVHSLSKWIPLTPEMALFADAARASSRTIEHGQQQSRLKQLTQERPGDECQVDDDIIDVAPEPTPEPEPEPQDVPPGEISKLEQYMLSADELEDPDHLDNMYAAAKRECMSDGQLDILAKTINKRKSALKGAK